ncbi:MAG: DUF3343 domain-containing protein [Firmicutes bacterium]|nr:DUF3343 domain-containing protein [Bacillota bacterium]
MDTYYVATFHSVSQALRFEKNLKQLSLQITMMPVPRIISSSCGIAARFAINDLAAVQDAVAQGESDVDEVYLFSHDDKKVHAERVLKSEK